jgi:hypothetical protein
MTATPAARQSSIAHRGSAAARRGSLRFLRSSITRRGPRDETRPAAWTSASGAPVNRSPTNRQPGERLLRLLLTPDRLVDERRAQHVPSARSWMARRGLEPETPLEGRYPYLFLDAKVEKVRDGGRVVNKALVVAHASMRAGGARSSRLTSARPRPKRSGLTSSDAWSPRPDWRAARHQ